MSWAPPAGSRLELLEPLPYLELLGLEMSAGLVLTDSGGMQEETTYLGVPCLTIRPSTERPITCSQGTNRLVAAKREAIREAARVAWNGEHRRPVAIERWDGRTAERIADVLVNGASYPTPGA
jgi:UDP-N-acetylglucosamine 2-epimerase (non-hydrolysing)